MRGGLTGQSAAIDLRLAAAQGKYIATLDSDDLFASGKLSEQVAFLEENQDVGMAYGSGQAIDIKGRPLYETLPQDHREGGLHKWQWVATALGGQF